MVRSKEELIASITKVIGESTSDESISLLEDVTDTMDSLSDGENWKQKYEENDKEWRQKYKERFMTPIDEKGEPEILDEPQEPQVKTFEELFTTESK